MLQIYNTLTRRKEPFEPREPGRVRMYVCGMTVYDFCHIGHARSMVVFDMVARWLRASGYRLTHVRNITDIDDKIIRRAVETGQSVRAVTDRFIDEMHADEDALGVRRPDHEPRATEFVPQMVDLIGLLEKNGYAYRAANGDVNFEVARFAGYGKLSGKNPEELRAGERVAVDTSKRDSADFVLWKAAKPQEPDDVKWASSFGPGRPGWHIECSAMARSLLGDSIDIHGGGEDLQFPHHENEIAQSEGALFHGRPPEFVRYWMHNAFVAIDDEKMSKSLGNFFTIRDVRQQFDAEVIRLFVLRAQHRSPINYSDAHLDDARLALLRLYTARGELTGASTDEALASADWSRPLMARFRDAMNDDFNTPMALAALFDMAAELNRDRSDAAAADFAAASAVLGLVDKPLDLVRRTGLRGPARLGMAGESTGTTATTQASDSWIESRIAARQAAKAARDFAGADAIRDELLAHDVVLEDSRSGTTWRRQ